MGSVFTTQPLVSGECFLGGPGEIGDESNAIQSEFLGDISLHLRQVDRSVFRRGGFTQSPEVAVGTIGFLELGCLVGDVGLVGGRWRNLFDELGDVDGHPVTT